MLQRRGDNVLGPPSAQLGSDTSAYCQLTPDHHKIKSGLSLFVMNMHTLLPLFDRSVLQSACTGCLQLHWLLWPHSKLPTTAPFSDNFKTPYPKVAPPSPLAPLPPCPLAPLRFTQDDKLSSSVKTAPPVAVSELSRALPRAIGKGSGVPSVDQL